jgi:hypothetical protein
MGQTEKKYLPAERSQAVSDPPLLSGYLTKYELAAEIRVHPFTLDYWHRRGRGPARIHIASRVWYNRQTVSDWIAAQNKEKEA